MLWWLGARRPAFGLTERARRDGVVIGLWDYMRVGVPLMLLTLAAGAVWLRPS
jgi:Na+/H+ antiporter NhaD/arsenite permease-like protein